MDEPIVWKTHPDISWTDAQLKEAKIHKGKLKKLVRLLRESSELMRGLDLEVYGADGSGHLVHRSRPTHVDTPTGQKADFGCIVASVGPGFNGGGW